MYYFGIKYKTLEIMKAQNFLIMYINTYLKINRCQKQKQLLSKDSVVKFNEVLTIFF